MPTAYMPQDVIDVLAKAASRRHVRQVDALRIAVGFLQAADRAADDGLHVGASRDREMLDTVIMPRAVAGGQ
jgi:hypothetical protein